MPLSISKLEELLSEKGYIINKYFLMDGYCFYLETFSILTSELFFLYMPSKYNFKIDEGGNIYKIKYINMEFGKDIADNYGGKLDPIDLQDSYGITNYDIVDNKVEESLENNYKHAINISEISSEDIETIKGISRQMKRLKYSVQNLKYKLAIIYKNYICSIRRDDSIDCFFIKNYPREDIKKLLVVVDLETLYEKIDVVREDIKVVKDNIYHVLERNHGMHGKIISKIIENKKDMIIIPEKVLKKNIKYSGMILNLEKNLGVILETEAKFFEKLKQIENKVGENINGDISKFGEISTINNELQKLRILKAEISKNILSLRDKKEHSILNIDKIMFDNTVMLDTMFKNFSKLKEYA